MRPQALNSSAFFILVHLCRRGKTSRNLCVFEYERVTDQLTFLRATGFGDSLRQPLSAPLAKEYNYANHRTTGRCSKHRLIVGPGINSSDSHCSCASTDRST